MLQKINWGGGGGGGGGGACMYDKTAELHVHFQFKCTFQ